MEAKNTGALRPPAAGGVADTGDDFDLNAILSILRAGVWIIGASILVCLAYAAFLAWLERPNFRSSALLQVETSNAEAALISDLFGARNRSIAASAEMEIIRSRKVVSGAVERLSLDIEASPVYFPKVGEAIARRGYFSGFLQSGSAGLERSDPAIIEHAGYTWEPVELRVDRFEVPRASHGEVYILVATSETEFSLFSPTREYLGSGVVDQQLLIGEAPSAIGIFVSRIRADHFPVRFNLRKVPVRHVADSIRSGLQVEQVGVGTGIMELAYAGADRKEVARVLNAIIDEHLQLNLEQQAESAEKGLRFLDEQLQAVRTDLRAEEARLNAFRKNNLALDLSSETQSLLAQVITIESELRELRGERAQLLEKVTEQHPAIRELDEQVAQLSLERDELQQRVGKLPEKQQALLGLRRDVEVSTGLLTTLLTKAQELRLVKAGTVGSVRLIDPALPALGPTGSGRAKKLGAGLVLGLLIGVGIVFLRFQLKRGVFDAGELERRFGKPVFGVVPFSGMREISIRRHKGDALAILAAINPTDPAVEGVRSVRTGLHFALAGKKNPVIAVGGPSPGVGKSFISIKLAHVLAQGGAKVLLVDADMRRGHIHDYAGITARIPGLSEYLVGRSTLTESVQKVDANLYVMTAGTRPPNPAELLMSARFSSLLSDARNSFDCVVVDTAPVLAVTDGEIIAAHADALFTVVKWGESTEQEIRLTLRRFENCNVPISGLVLNAFKPKQAEGYGYHYGYSRTYGYKYK